MVRVIRTCAFLVSPLISRFVGFHKIFERKVSAELRFKIENLDYKMYIRHHTCMRLTCSSCQVSIEIERTKLEY